MRSTPSGTGNASRPPPAGLALAGAAYNGVGIAACVASGEAAADEVCRHLKN